MDVALTIHELVPGAKYFGSVTDNSKEAFDNIKWRDKRTKPSWTEMETKWSLLEPIVGVGETNEILIQDKMRELAVQALKNENKLPFDFSDMKRRQEN